MIDAATIYAARIARVDPPRDEPKVKVRIHSTTDVVECGLLIAQGTHEYTVYASDVPRLEALVEVDSDALRAAETDHRRHVGEVEERGESSRPYQPSLEASFRAVARRDRKPFREVVRVDVRPPSQR